MQLIIVLCLIAKLALVSGDCDVGKTVNDFDYNKFTGTWYFLYYQPNEDDDKLECVVDTYSVPDGNVSNLMTIAFDKRQEREVNFTHQIHDWDNTGFQEICYTESQGNCKMYIVAVDYDRYFVGKFCFEESDTVIIYVAFRSTSPDEATMTDAKKASYDNGISFDQLNEWNATKCRYIGLYNTPK